MWKSSEKISLGKRLLWWFGIYLGFQVPLIMWWPCFLDYPWGLAPYFAMILGSHQEANFRTTGYLFYFIHLALCSVVTTKRIFTLLMAVLALVLSLNTVSCIKTLGPHWYKGLPKIEGSTAAKRAAVG